MKRKLRLILVSIILLVPVASAQIEKVDSQMQLAYRHIVGQPLAEAIAALDSVKDPGQSKGNVMVRFNGGGPNNNLYIGERNTFEILIANSEPLAQLAVRFWFRPSALHPIMPWTRDYGQFPDSGMAKGVVRANSELAQAIDASIEVSVGQHDLTLFIRVKAGAIPIAVHDSPTLLFSLEMILPGGLPESVHELEVFPSTSSFDSEQPWMMTTVAGERFAPLFNGQEQDSPNQRRSRSAEFEAIDRQLCICPPLTSGKIPPDSLGLGLRVHTQYGSACVMGQGEVVLRGLMIFTGKRDELTLLGVRISRAYSADRIDVEIPIQKLPEVLRAAGVSLLYTQGGGVEMTNAGFAGPNGESVVKHFLQKVDPKVRELYEAFTGVWLEQALYEQLELPSDSIHKLLSNKYDFGETSPPIITPDQLAKRDGIVQFSDGTLGLHLILKYEGELSQITLPQVALGKQRRQKGAVTAMFPIAILPELLRYEVVKRLYVGGKDAENE